MSQLIKVAIWSGEPRASVIFVHGLEGHAYDTWRRGTDDQSFWPIWLAEDIDGLAVYTLSYAAPTSNWLGTAMAFQDRAVNILECLLGEPSLRKHPITFICHSLGGLIVKQLMLDLHRQRGIRAEAAALLDQVNQVVFVATPHTGSRHATYLDRLRFIAWPTSITGTLVANDPTLRSINVAYRGLAEERKDTLRHRIFYETLGTPAGVIVDEASSDPGLPGDPPTPIDADHIKIVKPVDRSALLYLRTRDFVATHSKQQGRGGILATALLPTIRTERSWNVIPKMLRIAGIVLFTMIGFKGVQALISPTQHPEKFDQLTEGQEQITEQQAKLLEKSEKMMVELVRENGVPRAALVAQLVRLGADPDITIEQIPKFVERFASEFREAREGLGDEAQRLLDVGDLDGAAALLATARARLQQGHAREEAALVGSEARIDSLKLNYSGAAAKFAEAAALVAFDPQAASGYMIEQADTLDTQGDEFGDNSALMEAIVVSRRAAELRPRGASPDDYGEAMLRLGISLARLGAREDDAEKLEEGIHVFREALEVRTRENGPLKWAEAQNDLGVALATLGQRENGSKKLEEGIDAFREALEVWTRENEPLEWARAWNNLGYALQIVGERESDPAKLEAAVAALRNALKELTRDRAPREWAQAQNNLGLALASLGRQDESSTEKLQEAAAAHREALKEQTRERVPLDWAMSHGNEGIALMLIAERRADVILAETALEQINTAFETLRDGGDTQTAEYYQKALKNAQASVVRLDRP